MRVESNIASSNQSLRMVQMPKLELSCWHVWDDRSSIANSNFPGVYVIAVTEKDLRHLPVQWPDVAYIGMTQSSSGLINRWRQFDKAIRERAQHSGGNTIREMFGAYESWTQKLFAAAMGVEIDWLERTPEDTLKLGWVSYLEYEAFAEFRRHSGSGRRRPAFNKR